MLDDPGINDNLIVFRLFPMPMDSDSVDAYKCYQLSTEDKASIPPTLTVWDSERTTPKQTLVFHSPRDLKTTRLVTITVGDIRSARTAPPDETIPSPGIIREPLPSDIPGANGHCGVTRLKRPDGYPKGKFQTLLEDLARRSLVEPYENEPTPD